MPSSAPSVGRSRQRLRDRTAILTAIAAPLALTALMGFALGGSHGGSGMRFCIADLDHSEQSAAFVGFVERPSLRARVVVEAVDSLPVVELRHSGLLLQQSGVNAIQGGLCLHT